MKKSLLALVVLVAAAGFAAAGAEGEAAQAEDVTVTMYKWGLPAGQEDWSEMEGLITAATGVDVEMIQAPSFTDYQTKVATLLSSGDTSIDLFDIDEYITYGNILGGFFEPLNDIFSADDLAAAPGPSEMGPGSTRFPRQTGSRHGSRRTVGSKCARRSTGRAPGPIRLSSSPTMAHRSGAEPNWSLRCALAGAVLMVLALENRTDTDPEQPVAGGDRRAGPPLRGVTGPHHD